MKPTRPPRVRDAEEFRDRPPPEASSRLLHWFREFQAGRWVENRRFRREGTVTKALILGIYVWEYLEIVSPMIDLLDVLRASGKGAADVPVPPWLAEQLLRSASAKCTTDPTKGDSL